MRSTATGSTVLALLLGLATAPAQAADVVGVAFVHGTGAQTNATQDYWQPAIIDTVRQGLPNSSNYVVINCDFTQYMWKPEAAGCLANQLTGFIDSRGITQLVVITHSNGGNVVRWILSNPTYDSRYPKIIRTLRKVTALAPSSAGTPLADAVLNGNTFETSLGWLLGYKNDAVRQQQVASMATYNAQNLYGTAGRGRLQRLRGLRCGKGQHCQHRTGQQGGMDRHGHLPHWVRSLRSRVPRPKHSRRLWLWLSGSAPWVRALSVNQVVPAAFWLLHSRKPSEQDDSQFWVNSRPTLAA